MVEVIVGTTTSREKKLYSRSTTIRTILEDNNVDYSVAQVMLDGATLQVGEMDKTLEENGVTADKCMLIACVKAANA